MTSKATGQGCCLPWVRLVPGKTVSTHSLASSLPSTYMCQPVLGIQLKNGKIPALIEFYSSGKTDNLKSKINKSTVCRLLIDGNYEY